MDYKVIKKVLGIQAGFPESSLSKVINKLEDKNINYICLDRRNSYEVDEKEIFKKNRYSWFLERAKNSINKKMKLETIINILNDKIDYEEIKEILDKIEGILSEYNYI